MFQAVYHVHKGMPTCNRTVVILITEHVLTCILNLRFMLYIVVRKMLFWMSVLEDHSVIVNPQNTDVDYSSHSVFLFAPV